MRRPWLWPGVIAASSLAAALGVGGLLPAPLRALVTLWFLAVCPGMAWVRLLNVDNSLARWTLAVGLSLALVTLLAEGMALAGAWSPPGAVAALIVLSLAGAALQLRAAHALRPSGKEGT